MNDSLRVLCCAILLFAVVGCDLVDPMRPTPHADTDTFGNLIEVVPDASEDGVWVATIRAGVPRALGRAEQAPPTPDVSPGIVARVTITRDTVVTVDDHSAFVMDIGPGTEVVAIPVPGTTMMLGDKELQFEAEQLMDFSTYARWRLPKLDLANAVPPLEDPTSINSDGIEHGPVPVGDGRILYFTARLRRPTEPNGSWIGATRDGIRPPGSDERVFERSYRTELGPGGWSMPVVVEIPGTEGAEQVQVTWVSADERRCMVTVSESGGEPWVGTSTRTGSDRAWGTVDVVAATEGGDAYDAVMQYGSAGRMVFASTRNGSSDLFIFDPAVGPAQPLQPSINTGGMEWCPRVGPANELYFVRGNRQLRFQDGTLHEVRPAGPHRAVVIEAQPSADGAWLFMAAPKLRPVEPDLDIEVAPLEADGQLGAPIPIDDWRP
ncbi:MAG: hypothetical protein PVG53_05175 [Holophagae bacterium]|jgi:hypothetical protein